MTCESSAARELISVVRKRVRDRLPRLGELVDAR
jgi:hypothetical protein